MLSGAVAVGEIMKKKLILASASPRRAAILEQLGLEYLINPSNILENFLERPTNPALLVKELALAKAKFVSTNETEGLVIGADTVVALDGVILEKPKDDAEAMEMLAKLSGNEHSVYTGLAVVDVATGSSKVVYEETRVSFHTLLPEIIAAYVATGEPLDKAGSYAIQGKGAALVRKINGCYFNVVGLPITKLIDLLGAFGVSIWQKNN